MVSVKVRIKAYLHLYRYIHENKELESFITKCDTYTYMDVKFKVQSVSILLYIQKKKNMYNAFMGRKM